MGRESAEIKEALSLKQLFHLSCVALTVTAMTFAIRAGMLNDLGTSFSLNKEQLGWIASMAFLGFPAATIIGGLLYNSIGPRVIMIIAFSGHIFGLILTILAGGFWGLIISTFLVGFANGAVEAACNPMIATLYSARKTVMLNRFHVWFPGGIVIGSLAALLIKKIGVQFDLDSTWQLEIAIMLLPTLIYGWLVFATKFPDVVSDRTDETDTLKNCLALLSPLFIFMCLLMTLTATSELGTQQWVGSLLAKSGANPMIILAMVTGLMAVGRYFAGPLVHALNSTGVLLMSAILTTLGVYLLSIATGPLVYVAATVFALGVCYFWPTMIGYVSENLPKTGALGMSVIGGAGMMGLAMWQPVIGRWLDRATLEAQASGLDANAVELAAGQATLSKILYFPVVLILAFGLLYILVRWKQKQTHATSDVID